MSKIVIKKRISLDFLGDEHQDSYLTFKSIPMREYKEYIEAAKGKDETKAVDFISDKISELFIEGKFFDGKELVVIEASDLVDLDIATTIQIFKILTGQDQSPKV